MKPRLVLGCVILLSGALVLGAEEAGPAILLRGVVAFSTNKLALLEATGLRDWRGEMILAEGEREGDTEVLEIVPTIGKVKIKNGGIVSEIGFSTDLPAEAWVQSSSIGQRAGTLEGSSFLRLQQAGPSQGFGVYQLLAGRSLIRPQSLPAFRLDVAAKGRPAPRSWSRLLSRPSRLRAFYSARIATNLSLLAGKQTSTASRLNCGNWP